MALAIRVSKYRYIRRRIRHITNISFKNNSYGSVSKICIEIDRRGETGRGEIDVTAAEKDGEAENEG